MNQVNENAFIECLTRGFPRSPLQVNALQESDAELIRIPGTGKILAITTDSIDEEIETGLYADPFLIGWMTVMVNASDLAAVGAEPVGILLNETLPAGLSEAFISDVQSGIIAACDACGMPVLGGDTNHSASLHMGGTALGMIPGEKFLTRVGCRAGDLLFISGKPGAGNSFAFNVLTRSEPGSKPAGIFKPFARLREGRMLVGHAACCIDTSDGFISALDQLMQINHCGFDIQTAPGDFIHPQSLNAAGSENIPPWLFLAGIHGEFELLFTLPAEKVSAFIHEAGKTGWEPVWLGTVLKEAELRMRIGDSVVKVDTVRIRNLYDETGGNLHEYLGKLFQMDQLWKMQSKQ